MDIDHGLLSKLEAYGVISGRHRAAIQVTLLAYFTWMLCCFVKYNYKVYATVHTGHINI